MSIKDIIKYPEDHRFCIFAILVIISAILGFGFHWMLESVEEMTCTCAWE